MIPAQKRQYHYDWFGRGQGSFDFQAIPTGLLTAALRWL
jgi:hypothetical protein